MSKTLEKAKKLIEELPIELPLRFEAVGSGDSHGMPGAVVGGLRSKDGRSVLVPVQESASMVAGMPSVVKFLVEAPNLLAELVRELERPEKPQNSQ